MSLDNTYSNAQYAEAYSTLEFPGTYHLAFRDLPALLGKHVAGDRAIDFGCGAGRSTRFLRKLGFQVLGIDISADMIRKAHQLDPGGDYQLIARADFRVLGFGCADLVLAAFTFDNIPTREQKLQNLLGLRQLLSPGGSMIVLVSSPELYIHEWASFSTKDFPENRQAQSGDSVKIIITAIPDSRPVDDVVCSDEAYQEIFKIAGFEIVKVHRPLGRKDEPFPWVNETLVPPWVIYILSRAKSIG